MTDAELLESLSRHFLACPSLSTSQLVQHKASGTCPDCDLAPVLAGIKVIVSEDQPPGTFGMISHGRDFSSVGVCVLSDPPVVAMRTIRWPALAETVHRSPPDGGGLMPCCDRTPFEVPRTDRMTLDEALVTCGARVTP